MAKKKFLSFAAAFIAAAQALTLVTATGVAEEAIPGADLGYISVDTAEALPDNDELLGMYLNKMFYGGEISLYKDYGRENLSGMQLKIYEELRKKIEDIAAGKDTSTVYTYIPDPYYTDNKLLGSDIGAAVSYLMIDMPEEFYWYDKTAGYKNNYSGANVGGETRWTKCEITFSPAKDYAGSEANTVDPSKIKTAQEAVSKAAAIADKYAGKTVYEKVIGFKDEICKLTSYDDSARDSSPSVKGINPWQMISVFDGDPNTNVVCEGYSKAFQYLCDMGGVECYTVTGEMNGGTGAGGHMWNIVVMDDGKSYLVDVTNCDAGTVGADDLLCLKGAKSSTATNCEFTANGKTITYRYYDQKVDGSLHEDTVNMFPASVLTVSTEDYDPTKAHTHTPGEWKADGKNHVQECTECGSVVKTEAHKAAAAYKSDGTDHWQLCSVCSEEMNKTAHTYGDWNSDEDGHWKVCKVCNVKGATAAHKSSGAATEEKAETCTDCGFEIAPQLEHTHDWSAEWIANDTQHWHKCTKCETGKNGLADHDWGEGTVTKAATCTEDGVMTYTCECGKTKTEAIEATGHDYEAVTTDATCTTDGVKTSTCKECGDVQTEVIKATGHDFDKGTVTKAATCTEEGVKTFTCTVCETTKTEPIEKLPHTYDNDNWTKDDDNHTNTCTVCGNEITEPHSFVDGEITTAPTCTEAGERSAACVCGETKTVAVEALGHEPGEAVRENEVPATADKDGSYDSVIRCTRCNEIIESNKVVIPMTSRPSPAPVAPAEPATPSNPTTPDTSDKSDSDVPSIKGEDDKNGWEVIGDEIKSAKDNDVISIDMNNATVVPKSVFEDVRGKDVTVSFEMGNDLVWSVNGKTITADSLKDIDLSVKTGSSFIPESVIGTITGEKPFTQISLAHDGEFGFTAVLSVNVGRNNAEMFASLYYYNGGKLDKIDTEEIGVDGNVKFSFKHASDYLITVHEEKTANEPANDNNSEANPSGNPNTGLKTDSVIWIAALSCLVLTAPVFKRSKKS